MSLVVNNAYRYPLQAQRYVHSALMGRCVEKTAETVNLFTERLLHHVLSLPPSEWKAELDRHMSPDMEHTKRSQRDLDSIIRRATGRGDISSFRERFVRTYLKHYTTQIMNNLSTWPLYDIGISWSYTWDSVHGYVTLYLPPEIASDDFIAGIACMEPFGYDGRCGETDHPTVPADEVAAVWDRLVGHSSMGFAGATARLDGFERDKAFGLI